MYVKLRMLGCNNREITIKVSKLTKVKVFKEVIHRETLVEPEKQRLFYKGKQLEDEYTLFDYQINLNDVIQLMEKNEVKSEIAESSREEPETYIKEEKEEMKNGHLKSCWKSIPSSLYFKVGEYVDVRSVAYGAWFEGQILDIKAPLFCCCKEAESVMIRSGEDYINIKKIQEDILYTVMYQKCPGESEETNVNNLRPKARKICDISTLRPGMIVLVNYNVNEPYDRGLWFDCKLTRVGKIERTISGNLIISSAFIYENINIRFVDEVMKIEKRVPVKLRTKELEESLKDPTIIKRSFECRYCEDDVSKLCGACGCVACGSKEEPEKQLVCDECNKCFHLQCLIPPLDAIPDDDWFCPNCKVDASKVVMAGDKLKESKRMSTLVSYKKEVKKDWGRGMACVGRTKECTIVPSNHYGPIPGIEVGTTWLFRVQASEAGVHRPPVAGIHGRESDGAYSIVLSGGYEDDVDNGEEFLYTGSGGRDLSGNRRTAEQSCDQELTHCNRALAKNCDAPLDCVNGAKAKDWRNGKPVRVLRSHKLKAHSKYAPEKGCRYDGIYKVVEYWREKGKSGFYVWRYLLKRDDEVPAPWTEEGIDRMESLGLQLIYPDGYQEAMKQAKRGSVSKKKRKIASPKITPEKSRKVVAYKLPPNIKKLVDEDCNKKLWDECKAALTEGKPAFLSKVSEAFTCICCCELVFKPVTTKCRHNLCMKCLERAIAAEVTACPCCRSELDLNKEFKVNDALSSILLSLFPGYENGRSKQSHPRKIEKLTLGIKDSRGP